MAIWHNVVTINAEFKLQTWHVSYADSDGEPAIVAFETRKVAEEISNEVLGMFWLCDCPNRECQFIRKVF